jgi:cyclic lactone autoinducer peptide
MKTVKQKVLSIIADVGKRTAVKSAGAASYFCYHQPKEPIGLRDLLNKTDAKTDNK